MSSQQGAWHRAPPRQPVQLRREVRSALRPVPQSMHTHQVRKQDGRDPDVGHFLLPMFAGPGREIDR